jgi:hypothetical protein
MAFAASNLVGLLVLITWACLAAPVHKHPLFMQIFPSQAVLSEIISAASLSFCPGLFDAIQAAGPPPLSFFRNLPVGNLKKWAVYALVLEKPGFESLVYIGSGTNLKGGVRSRFAEYDRGQKLLDLLSKL